MNQNRKVKDKKKGKKQKDSIWPKEIRKNYEFMRMNNVQDLKLLPIGIYLCHHLLKCILDANCAQFYNSPQSSLRHVVIF